MNHEHNHIWRWHFMISLVQLRTCQLIWLFTFLQMRALPQSSFAQLRPLSLELTSYVSLTSLSFLTKKTVSHFFVDGARIASCACECTVFYFFWFLSICVFHIPFYCPAILPISYHIPVHVLLHIPIHIFIYMPIYVRKYLSTYVVPSFHPLFSLLKH